MILQKPDLLHLKFEREWFQRVIGMGNLRIITNSKNLLKQVWGKVFLSNNGASNATGK